LEDLSYSFFAKPKDPLSFDSRSDLLASPEKIRDGPTARSKSPRPSTTGPSSRSGTGLFCAKIFGPTKDYECNCGKYKRMKHRGVVCEKCGVEVIQSKVRRERMGHIELASPVAHIWFLKSLPSKIGNLLDLTLKDLEKVLYFESLHRHRSQGDAPLTQGQMLIRGPYRQLKESSATPSRPAWAPRPSSSCWSELDLEDLYPSSAGHDRDHQRGQAQEAAKRLKVVDAFRDSATDPSWMIMDVIPVLPPDLRPWCPWTAAASPPAT
jgi:DNA-directed RNA polymerase subunit beta'